MPPTGNRIRIRTLLQSSLPAPRVKQLEEKESKKTKQQLVGQGAAQTMMITASAPVDNPDSAAVCPGGKQEMLAKDHEDRNLNSRSVDHNPQISKNTADLVWLMRLLSMLVLLLT